MPQHLAKKCYLLLISSTFGTIKSFKSQVPRYTKPDYPLILQLNTKLLKNIGMSSKKQIWETQRPESLGVCNFYVTQFFASLSVCRASKWTSFTSSHGLWPKQIVNLGDCKLMFGDSWIRISIFVLSLILFSCCMRIISLLENCKSFEFWILSLKKSNSLNFSAGCNGLNLVHHDRKFLSSVESSVKQEQNVLHDKRTQKIALREKWYYIKT